jgi:hypothetical protein
VAPSLAEEEGNPTGYREWNNCPALLRVKGGETPWMKNGGIIIRLNEMA